MCDVDVIVLQETVTATTRKWKLESCGERTVLSTVAQTAVHKFYGSQEVWN